MGGHGPAPKPDDQRQRRNTPANPPIELEETVDVSTLAPHRLPGAKGFLKRTRDWHKMWLESPQAKVFLATDFHELEMIAVLLDAFYRGDYKLAPEIRLREAALGKTHADRLRLNLRVKAKSVEVDKADKADDKGTANRKRSRSKPDQRLALLQGGRS